MNGLEERLFGGAEKDKKTDEIRSEFMLPQTEIIEILGHLKRKYKDRFYYKMKYGEVDIDIITREIDASPLERYPTHIFDKKVVTKSFTFDEVLSWHKNPEREFERSWQSK